MSGPARPPNDCFALPPGVHWTPVDEALARLKAAMAPLCAVESCALWRAHGKILAQDVTALRAHPASDNAAVDGYAFQHTGDLGECAQFSLVEGRAAAGVPWNGVLDAGHALRILTGAPMPKGSDTVVLQEDVEVIGTKITFAPPRKPGANRRRAGENIGVGDIIARQGARLTPQCIAQLASAGIDHVYVRRPLRVAILSTGDELVDVAAAFSAAPEHVIDANAPMLSALTLELGFEVALQRNVADTARIVADALDEATAKADAVITSGGASSGDEDHLARLLLDHDNGGVDGGVDGGFHLWRIAVKPGRPLAVGHWRGTPVFGLPGNPVAAFVCFLIFVRPALIALAGGNWPDLLGPTAPADFAYRKKPGRREFLRVRLNEAGRLEKFHSEGSGLIRGLIWSTGLADIPHEAGPFEAGALLRYYSWAELGIRS